MYVWISVIDYPFFKIIISKNKHFIFFHQDCVPLNFDCECAQIVAQQKAVLCPLWELPWQLRDVTGSIANGARWSPTAFRLYSRWRFSHAVTRLRIICGIVFMSESTCHLVQLLG